MTRTLAVLMALSLPLLASGQAQHMAPNPDAEAVEEFRKRVDGYMTLHKKIEAALPKLPEEATPEQIDRHQRGLALQIVTARTGARRGDLFSPRMEAIVERVLTALLTGPKGQQLRSSIFDENPTAIPVAVNERYPDDVPLSTMPMRILKELPTLPAELEYRFVGTSLILLDVPAHIIVDFIPDALPL